MNKKEHTASEARTADLLDYDQAAAYLNTTPHWMRRARFEGRIPFVKLGRLVRFRRSDLDAYIEENLHESASS